MSDMTEDEAKTKRCCGPYLHNAATYTLMRALVIRFDDTVADPKALIEKHADEGLTDTLCIGSECMAWRWHDPDTYYKETGYCGLAGKP